MTWACAPRRGANSTRRSAQQPPVGGSGRRDRLLGHLLDHSRLFTAHVSRLGVRGVGAQGPGTSGKLPNGEVLPLFRLRYAGSADTWGFAIYGAGHDDYQNSHLPTASC